MNQITEQELKAIRFYMGDEEIVNQKIYLGGNQAYNTINALLHQGIQNEIDLIKEGRKLEIINQEHLLSILSLICDIYTAMVKYQKNNENNLKTYRIDRESTIQAMKKNHQIEGFFSTCKYGYLEEYAHIKSKVILLEVIRQKDVPYLDFEDLFNGYYAKPQEAEILLPFDTKIESIKKVRITREEKMRYYDLHGNQPVGKYQIKLSKQNYEIDNYSLINMKWLTSEDTINHVQKCLHELTNHLTLQEEDYRFYIDWKEKLHHSIKRKIIGLFG